MDEFYRLKPGETVENVLRYNAASVLLSDLGSDFNVRAGETKKIAFSISNYDAEMTAAELCVTLARPDGHVAWSERRMVDFVPNGRIVGLGEFAAKIPDAARAVKYILRTKLSDGARKVDNEWEIYAFPAKKSKNDPSNVKVVEDIGEAELASALAKGERVLLLGAGPFRALPTTYRIGMAGRTSGNYATVVKEGHPALKEFPHEGFCGWQFRRLMEGGRAVQLEADVPFDSIIDIASSVKFPIRQAGLFEYRVGEGRLLVCSFAFHADDPAAAWMRAQLVDYAAGEAFNPPQSLTPAQLHAVIAAPLLSGARNGNVARNPGDPSSGVRAGDLAQP